MTKKIILLSLVSSLFVGCVAFPDDGYYDGRYGHRYDYDDRGYDRHDDRYDQNKSWDNARQERENRHRTSD